MPLVISTLEEEIKTILTQTQANNANEANALIESTAKKLAKAIDTYIKSATVTVNVTTTGSASAQAGTGTGTLT